MRFAQGAELADDRRRHLMRGQMRGTRLIRQCRGTAAAKALDPLVAGLLANARRATDVDDAFPRGTVQNCVDEGEAL